MSRYSGSYRGQAIRLQMLQLLSLAFLFLSPLTLSTVIQQESKSTTEREDDETLKNVRIHFIAIVPIATINVVFVVVRFVVVPAREFGFEERTKPFRKGKVFLDDCEVVSDYVLRHREVMTYLARPEWT